MMVGDAAIATHCLRRLVDAGFDVVGCLPGSDAFAAECRGMGVRAFEVDSDLDVLLEEPCDWILSVFNIRILPRRVIEHPSRGVVNFHDGPLPRYAGLYAPTRALIDGEKEHGVAWHLVDEGIDTGDLLVEEAVSIEADDTALSLQLRCLEAGCRSFERLIPMLRVPSPAGDVAVASRVVAMTTSPGKKAPAAGARPAGASRSPLGAAPATRISGGVSATRRGSRENSARVCARRG